MRCYDTRRPGLGSWREVAFIPGIIGEIMSGNYMNQDLTTVSNAYEELDGRNQ